MGIFGIFTNKPIALQAAAAAAAAEEPKPELKPLLTPPLSLDRDAASTESSSERSTATAARIVELLCGVGADLTRFQLPVHFNMPKSQLQLYGEMVYCTSADLLGAAAAAATPLSRFLAVLRWHISTTRPPPFGKAPFNPILGETHHVSLASLNILLEQVSHHPPISALHATDDDRKIELTLWHQPCPKFYGSGVEVSILGSRSLRLRKHGEEYRMTSPKLALRFLPLPASEWSGTTLLSCSKTGLQASLTFKGKSLLGLHGSGRRVVGKVWDTQTEQTLYDVHGNWDGLVHIRDKRSNTTSTLYDARQVLVNLRAPRVRDCNAVSPTESALVWSPVTQGILDRDMDKARAAKARIEEEQRSLRKQRCAPWTPKFFRPSQEGGWEWQQPEQSVPPAPIVVPKD